MSNRTLVTYFSMTGNTQKLAQEVRVAFGEGVDLEEIREPHPRHGATGMVRSLFDAMTRRRPPIAPATRDPANYDLVVLGGPVWAGRMAPPVRTYARRYGAKARQLAFFCTEDSTGADQAFADLAKLCQHAPKATMIVDSEHLEPDSHRAYLAHFVAAAKRAAAH